MDLQNGPFVGLCESENVEIFQKITCNFKTKHFLWVLLIYIFEIWMSAIILVQR